MRYNEQINLKLYKYTNGSFQAQAIIDDYQEISFSHNLYEAGDFTITINYNIPNALKFERGMFVQFGNDPYMFGEILTISDAIGEDGKGSQIRTITGKDARYIFKRRIIKNLNNEENWAMTDKGEICLRELVKAQCGTGAEAKRQLPVSNTIPASSSALGKEYSVAEAFSNLYDTLVTIATQSEIGWRIAFDGSLTLEVFEGADLSSQVQFSTDYDSLSNGEFTDSSESYANTVYVAGKGTGSDRDIYEGEQEIEGGSPSGLDRYEAYDNQSSMTSESEYEAEALSMLTQYGQTINVSGQGLAKCPYIFQEQYNIGDTITLAFSGKSAKAQILSVTEHWTWGQYGIEFSFGKPQNDLSRQLQLILKQIQKASNKTTTTSSVKYYTIPTDTTMPKADVIYDRIGFIGNVGNGATFQLYYDSEKTGAKCYHIYFKELAGTGKLTLTTGVTGKANLSLNAGTYVAIVYVDGEGNVTTEGATPTTTISSGNTQPATSGGVAQAISEVPQTINEEDGLLARTSFTPNGDTWYKIIASEAGSYTYAINLLIATNYPNRQGASKTIDILKNASNAIFVKEFTVSGGGYEFDKIAITHKTESSGDITGIYLHTRNLTGIFTDKYLSAKYSARIGIKWDIKEEDPNTTGLWDNKTEYNLHANGEYVNGENSIIAKGIGHYFTCSTASSSATKIVNVEGFVLTKGTRINVFLQNPNTSVSQIQLNVGNTGAINVKWNGSITSPTNYALPSDVYECYYDGNYWYMDNQTKLNDLRCWRFFTPDYTKYILLADITKWYNSTSSSEVQAVGFIGKFIRYRTAGYVAQANADITLSVGYYRDGVTLPNTQRTDIAKNNISNSNYVSVGVIQYQNKYYLAIRLNTIQSAYNYFFGYASQNPLLTLLTNSDTVTEIYIV